VACVKGADLGMLSVGTSHLRCVLCGDLGDVWALRKCLGHRGIEGYS
jgi:hypothetical protein